VGSAIAQMHDAEIVHGDLTTSNIMVRHEDSLDQVVLIDFGLGAMKPTAEDKAVDLYVLERAFISTHNGSESFVSFSFTFMDVYMC
jgi:TP53 regulating kinase-like protein